MYHTDHVFLCIYVFMFFMSCLNYFVSSRIFMLECHMLKTQIHCIFVPEKLYLFFIFKVNIPCLVTSTYIIFELIMAYLFSIR